MNLSQELKTVRDEKTIIGVQRRKDDLYVGFVESVNEVFVLLQSVVGGIQLDAFHVLRIADLCAMQVPYEHHAFAQKAMAKRGDVRVELDVDLSSWHTIIESTRSEFPIGRYELYSDENEFYVERACGRIITLDDEMIAVRSIDESGIWQKGQTFLSLGSLTRYSFGGQREQFLAEFARDHTPIGPQLPNSLPQTSSNEGESE